MIGIVISLLNQPGLAEHARSGLSLAEFCRRQGQTPWTFRRMSLRRSWAPSVDSAIGWGVVSSIAAYSLAGWRSCDSPRICRPPQTAIHNVRLWLLDLPS
jgi:hypothetical protein